MFQGVAVCCSVFLQRHHQSPFARPYPYFIGSCTRYISVLQCVAVCCSVLQCVAVCCSVLQGFAGRCRALHSIVVSCILSQFVSAAVPPASIRTPALSLAPSSPSFVSATPDGGGVGPEVGLAGCMVLRSTALAVRVCVCEREREIEYMRECV